MGIEETDFGWGGEQCGKGFTEQVASQWSITTSQMDWKGEKSIPEIMCMGMKAWNSRELQERAVLNQCFTTFASNSI